LGSFFGDLPSRRLFFDAMPRFSDWCVQTQRKTTEGEAKTMSIAAGRYGSKNGKSMAINSKNWVWINTY
jgi:hypothetical protein